MSAMRVVFMGTPEFAAASLRALLAAGFNVVGVITAPDKPGGRGMQLQQSEVKKTAIAHSLPLLQPDKLKHPEFIEQLRQWKADVQVVVAFRMLPEVVWNMPPLGTINVHASLLPQYRGAAPINWAIINGETETGITTFKLKHAIDTGDMLLQKPVSIGPDETAGELHEKLKNLGAQLIVQTLRDLQEGSLSEMPQNADGDTDLKHAPKITTETCVINAHQPAFEVHNLIRGLSPVPGAMHYYKETLFKIYSSALTGQKPQGKPGNFFTAYKSLYLTCADGCIEILELQQQGKKRLPARDFINGFRF